MLRNSLGWIEVVNVAKASLFKIWGNRGLRSTRAVFLTLSPQSTAITFVHLAKTIDLLAILGLCHLPTGSIIQPYHPLHRHR